MAHIHAVLGPGGDKVPASVIQDGLKDLLEKGDSVALPWYSSPVSDGLEAVYDYIMENEIPFTMFYSGRKPPVPFEVDHGELSETKNIQKSLAQMASPGSNLLVLFPDGDEDIAEEIFGFLDFAPGGVTVLDLTNGLVPIKVNDDEEPDSEEEKEAEAEETDEDSLDGFTREELMGLSLKLLKRAAANIAPGVTIDSKEQAIALILGEDAPVLVEEEVVAEKRTPTVAPTQEVKDEMNETAAKAALTLKAVRDDLRATGVDRTRSLAITKIEEAILWLGGVL